MTTQPTTTEPQDAPPKGESIDDILARMIRTSDEIAKQIELIKSSL